MTHQNLVLTEKAIKNHCKRLHKEIIVYHKEFTLSEAQNLFARTLGFKNFHELKIILNNKKSASINTIDEFYKFIEDIEHKSDFIYLYPDGQIKYLPYNSLEENVGFITINEYKFINLDWENILGMLLNHNDLMHLKDLEYHDRLSLMFRKKINDNLSRNIIAQFFTHNNQVYAIKLIIQYYSVDQFTKHYKDIKNLF
jgi:hypothetical protein